MIEISKINIRKTKLLKRWIAGESYEAIGNSHTPPVSKQAIERKVKREIELLPDIEEILLSVQKVAKVDDKSYFPFLSFDGHPQGRLLAHLARQEMGYSIIGKVHCTLEKIGQAKLKTNLIKATKNKIPIYIDGQVKNNPYAFTNEMFFVTKEPFSKYFQVAEVEDAQAVVALDADSMLYTICSWMKNRPNMEIEDIFSLLTENYKKMRKVKTLEQLKEKAASKTKHIYAFEEPCKRRLLTFAGVQKKSTK